MRKVDSEKKLLALEKLPPGRLKKRKIHRRISQKVITIPELFFLNKVYKFNFLVKYFNCSANPRVFFGRNGYFAFLKNSEKILQNEKYQRPSLADSSWAPKSGNEAEAFVELWPKLLAHTLKSFARSHISSTSCWALRSGVVGTCCLWTGKKLSPPTLFIDREAREVAVDALVFCFFDFSRSK